MMGKKIGMLTLALSAVSVSVHAANVEVIHWWTSGGEQKAVTVFADEYNKLGGDSWVDSAVALGENARALTMQRILGGDAPGAAQFNTSRQFEELIEEGLLLDLTPIAKKEGWLQFIRPTSVLDPCMKDGGIYCVPVNIHSNQWLWTNKKVFADAGLQEPTTWKEFLQVAPKLRAAGVIPLALGGQAWQERHLFDVVMIGTTDKAFWSQIWDKKDPEAASGDTMRGVFETFGALRQFIDQGSPGRNWNDATNMVITGKAATQVMGDWARGEFSAANLKADVDYGCIPGPSIKPYLTLAGDAFIFPKTDDADLENAQFKMASMMLSPQVQAKFNNAKGSLPVRDDVDMSLADACMKKGLKLLENTDATFAPANVYITADTNGQVDDLITTFWNEPDMSVDTALTIFAGIIDDAE
ncbi:ABC transporter substrate-binding protein [Marinomonas sp. IMCC 4694]|uniref:ABC transporter substrate-binding protein n=1 Tax=Marinomonas sp. IMCC 4694 TaxID=2605432 RepID=UPI0011E6C3B0|nr:ABC transporter substrate-binding protein [Marinomonas sp. IMCC 4694]TYL46961.1 carbohydrate ABC transporter substrate-binding protein [Marinomonas sp. IMCC 4694]